MMKSTFDGTNPEQKKNKAIKNIIWLILFYTLIKNDQKRSKMINKCQKKHEILDFLWSIPDVSEYGDN